MASDITELPVYSYSRLLHRFSISRGRFLCKMTVIERPKQQLCEESRVCTSNDGSKLEYNAKIGWQSVCSVERCSFIAVGECSSFKVSCQTVRRVEKRFIKASAQVPYVSPHGFCQISPGEREILFFMTMVPNNPIRHEIYRQLEGLRGSKVVLQELDRSLDVWEKLAHSEWGKSYI